MESIVRVPMEIYRNWFAIMDLTARQIYRGVGQPTLDMFIYLSLATANGTKVQVRSADHC